MREPHRAGARAPGRLRLWRAARHAEREGGAPQLHHTPQCPRLTAAPHAPCTHGALSCRSSRARPRRRISSCSSSSLGERGRTTRVRARAPRRTVLTHHALHVHACVLRVHLRVHRVCAACARAAHHAAPGRSLHTVRASLTRLTRLSLTRLSHAPLSRASRATLSRASLTRLSLRRRRPGRAATRAVGGAGEQAQDALTLPSPPLPPTTFTPPSPSTLTLAPPACSKLTR